MKEGVYLKKASTDNVAICQGAEVASPRKLGEGANPKPVDGNGKAQSQVTLAQGQPQTLVCLEQRGPGKKGRRQIGH